MMDLYTRNFCEKSFNKIFACRWRKLVCCTADCRDIDYGNIRVDMTRKYLKRCNLYCSDIYIGILISRKDLNFRRWNVSLK